MVREALVTDESVADLASGFARRAVASLPDGRGSVSILSMGSHGPYARRYAGLIERKVGKEIQRRQSIDLINNRLVYAALHELGMRDAAMDVLKYEEAANLYRLTGIDWIVATSLRDSRYGLVVNGTLFSLKEGEVVSRWVRSIPQSV